MSNSDVPVLGGASAIRFARDGEVRDAYRILSGADFNRGGGATPWRTWLSCESSGRGRIFECDPYGVRAATPRLAMGRFRHQAAVCDPERYVVYLTEDEEDGCLYRFRPLDWGALIEGRLEVLCGGPGPVVWRPVPSPAALFTPARGQVPGAARFVRADGCHYANGVLAFATADGRIWSYDAEEERLDVVDATRGGLPEINMMTPEGGAGPLLRLIGQGTPEITGPAFSPDGRRLYFSVPRPAEGGVTYEVTGPFRP
ncbi:alkaline phosphatase PhoX [Spongiactinospora sp. TRM90649]|uniref:alkaline phosphatase PhoX n=1 Tax=Spongiactinospora sp. TRM90649 TaxID=3031114 RepID=UPI0023F7D51A|nr:alkaline phosphatase PhoX [Spongiactinospora sp. TRM90649]MDF5758458.1 DUF839 domain-containing protein [Spongiactinospora sp. TRM90649]